MDATSIDNLLIELNPFGLVQKLFLICSAYVQFFTPLTGQSINFLAATPNHHCVVKDGLLLNQSIPVEEDSNGNLIYSKCQEYVHPETQNVTQDCQNGWEYDHDVYGETIVSEWDLVCKQNAAAEVSQSVLQMGGFIGAFIFGILADRFGRRPSFLLAVFLYSLFGTALCFSINFTMFVVLRFFCGFSQMAVWVAFSGSISEYMIPKYRNRAMNVPSISFSFGLMFMALMAYLVRDWRYLQLSIVTPMTVGFFGMWFLPESLRWLIGKGKFEDVDKLIVKLARINGADLPRSYKMKETGHDNKIFTITEFQKNESDVPEDKFVNNKHSEQTSGMELSNSTTSTVNGELKSEATTNKTINTKKSYLDLFKLPVLQVTIITSTLRFAHSMIYFGFALNTGRLAGNPYLNFFYSALVEVPARVLSPYLYKKIRRTYLVSFCYFSCTISLAVMIFIPATTKNNTDLSILTTLLSLLGKFFIVLSRGGVLLLIMELFPTTMRNMGNGFTTCTSRIGAIISPLMLYMDNFIADFSTILMAVIACVAAFSVLILPDTRQTAQPQTTEDLKRIMKAKKMTS